MSKIAKKTVSKARRPLWLRLFRWTLFMLSGLILSLGLIWAGLQTRWAKNYLMNLVSSVTANTDDYRVTLRGLDGLLPFTITVDQVTISDAKGPWLEGEKFDFSMKAWDLLAGSVQVEWLRMKWLLLSRLPEPAKPDSKKEKPPAKSGNLSLPHIMVQEIQLKRIELGKAVAGKSMAFSLQSEVKTAGSRVNAEASLTDLNHGDDAFHLIVAYDMAREHVTADLDYHESKGGLVAGLAGLKDLQGIELILKADGPLSGVKGCLNLNMGGYGKAELRFRYGVELDGAMDLQMDGQIKAESRVVPSEVAQAMDSLSLNLTCRATLSPQNVLDLKRFMIRNGANSISLEGNADIEKERMDVRGLISGVNIEPFLRGTWVSVEDLGPVRITAKGPFMQPDVTVTATAGNLMAQGASLKEITLEIRAGFEQGFSGLKNSVVGLKTREVRLPQAPDLRGPLKVDIQAQSPDFLVWRVKDLLMAMPGISVRLEDADVDAARGRFSADFQVHVDRIAPFLPSQASPIDGRLEMRGHAEAKGKNPVKANLNMAISQISGLPPEASCLIGPNLTLAARAAMMDRVVTLKGVHLKGEHAELNADGWLNLSKSAFDVAYDMSLNLTGNPLSAGENLPVGNVESRGKISGGFHDFSAQVNLSSQNIQLKALDVKGVKVQLEANGLPQKTAGSIRVEGAFMGQPLKVDTDFAWSGKTFVLRKARAHLPGIDLRASVSLTPGPNHFSGTVEGKITSMDILQGLAGVDARGTGRFRIEAGEPGGKMTEDRGQRTEDRGQRPGVRRPLEVRQTPIALDAEFKGLRYEDYEVSSLHVKARVDDIETMRGRASLKAAKVSMGITRLETLKLGATGALAGAEVTLETKGLTKTATEAALFLSTKIFVKRADLWQFRLDALKADYEDLKITLGKPATLTLGDGRIALDNLELQTDKGQLQAKGKLERKTVEASARITDLPLSLLEPFVGQDLSGRAEVRLDLSGPLADPGVNVAVHIQEYKVMGRDKTKPLLMNLKLHSKRDGDRFLADLELSGLGKTPFTASGSIPAHISLKPFAFDVDKSGKLDGKLQGKFDLVVLETLPAMEGQRLRGRVEVDLGVGGSLEKWDLNGGVTLSDGRYENVELGMILDRIQGRLSAEGRALRLTDLTATDGGSGTITLRGRTEVDPPFQTEIALTIKQATLLRKETLTVTAGGNLYVKGSKDRMDLTGEINLDRAEISIPKRFPPDLTVIPVKTINDPAAASPENEKSGGGATMIQMDLGVNISDKIFVRGRGLDAEFKGRLKVQGPADNPVVRGNLNVVRGTFQCLSRTFNIISGQIAFDGATPPVPFLNINTRVNAGEITARMDISGPADAFKLKLSSQPPLPQDEIMAQILFGQSVAKLNTFQALQLAYSVNELAGGYGPDVIGKTRDLLGLDRLGFSGGDQDGRNNGDDSDDSNGPSITLGKYVTDRVYVGIEQDLTDAKQDVIVEVNITPNFMVESKAGTKSGAGLGFNWNYDY
ncbi:MAG: translocation/assembly module TamB domain-containing protein [Thermodesulfobacteriota bacterium]|nr:translocation/assembly module TamB domain-containing protein [Thermodesulfobacteriota bacterium]